MTPVTTKKWNWKKQLIAFVAAFLMMVGALTLWNALVDRLG